MANLHPSPQEESAELVEFKWTWGRNSDWRRHLANQLLPEGKDCVLLEGPPPLGKGGAIARVIPVSKPLLSARTVLVKVA